MKRAARRDPGWSMPTDAVRGEWLRRVEAEYRSASITVALTHWMIQLGAPTVLVRAGLRIVGDELRHAELSHRVYREAGGVDVPAIAIESLQLVRAHGNLEHDVARIAVHVFCLGETVAVRLFHRLRAQCTVPVARATLDRILRDEVRHRDFGWKVLDWLMLLPSAPELRTSIIAALPHMLSSLQRSYGGSVAADQQLSPARTDASARAWGLMPRSEYGKAVAQCIARDIRPRFARQSISLPPSRSTVGVRGSETLA